MTDTTVEHYPDVFGAITDDRHAIGAVEVALATRPRNVKAGREFEVIMLIQNTVEAPVDVTVQLKLPNKDHDGKKDRFITHHPRLVVGVAPAEVGYVTLPMTTLPDTAVGTDYVIGMDVNVKQIEKGEQVRHADANLPLNTEALPIANRTMVEELQKLQFSTKQRRTFRGTVLETSISVIQGKLGKTPQLTPGWQSIWTLEEQGDLELLVQKYGDLLRTHVVPRLKPNDIFEPIAKRIFMLFKRSEYPLTKEETLTATRLVVGMLDASAGQSGAISVGEFDVLTTVRSRQRDQAAIEKRRLIDGDVPALVLPRWAASYLRLIAKDERVARGAVKVVTELLFDDVLYDAMIMGFRLVQRDGGEDLGSDEEMAAFAQLILDKLKKGEQMDFSHAYMPLIMGGMIQAEHVIVGDEKIADVMKSMRFMVEDREDEYNEGNAPIFRMATSILDITLKKYGFKDNR